MSKNNSNSWSATQKLLTHIDQQELLYYCPLKTNRRVDELVWSANDLQQGKLIKIRGFPRLQKGETVPGHCFF